MDAAARFRRMRRNLWAATGAAWAAVLALDAAGAPLRYIATVLAFAAATLVAALHTALMTGRMDRAYAAMSKAFSHEFIELLRQELALHRVLPLPRHRGTARPLLCGMSR